MYHRAEAFFTGEKLAPRYSLDLCRRWERERESQKRWQWT